MVLAGVSCHPQDTHLADRAVVLARAAAYEAALDRCVDRTFEILNPEGSRATLESRARAAAYYEKCAAAADKASGKVP